MNAVITTAQTEYNRIAAELAEIKADEPIMDEGDELVFQAAMIEMLEAQLAALAIEIAAN